MRPTSTALSNSGGRPVPTPSPAPPVKPPHQVPPAVTPARQGNVVGATAPSSVNKRVPVFGYPVAGAQITQAYGHRPTNPNIHYQSGTNLGTDFGASMGSAINAPVGGTVVGINSGAGAWGNQVIIDAGNGRQLSFNHLSGFGKIKKGQTINAGYVLGQVGSTGQTTGSHLDMEATVNGTSVPLSTAFKGYQFDKSYGGMESGVKGAQGYNRSQNTFYNTNDLSKSTGSVYRYGSGGPVTPQHSENSGQGRPSSGMSNSQQLMMSEDSSAPSSSGINLSNFTSFRKPVSTVD